MAMFKKNRPYTGWNGNSKGKLKGMEKFKDWVVFLNGGKIKNLGTWVVRSQRDHDQPSVHGTGRAIDLSYKNREDALALMDFLVRNAEAFGLEYIGDYLGGPFGRGWRCDRDDWTVYKKSTIGSGGSWIHVELSPTVASDAGYVDAVFACLLKPVK
jgi:hypothetical protein